VRAPICAAVVLLLLFAAAGCTQHRTITKDKQLCATNCGQTQTGCMTRCADPKQNVQVLEDIRGSLCEKRCREDYDKCMVACTD